MILAALEHHARATPDQPFVVDITGELPKTITYAEALAAVDDVARGMAALGVGQGDRVALRLRNSWWFVATLLATLRLGAIAVPTIRQYSLDELRYALQDCGATVLVADDEQPLDAGVTTVAAGAVGGGPEVALPVLGADDDALIFYTSGTTAQPKGVVLRHGAVLAAALSNAEGWRVRADDRAYVVLPLFHCNALFMQLLPVLLSGATAVVGDRFSASGYLDTVRRHGVTWANLTAGAIRSVLAQPERDDDREQPLRMLTFGLPLHAEEIATVRKRLGIPSLMAYGLTESCAGGVRTPQHVDPRAGWQSLGIAQPGWEIAIADEHDAWLPPGGVGQILLRGPGLMDRYWRRPEATDAALRGGWLHTGDLGRLDADGRLFFHSREKDMLKPKGENVAASEIEEALDTHPAVLESAVVGVHDPHHEERVVAFLTGTTPVAAEALAAHCRERLASFKVPSEFRWVDELPRTSIGKVNKGQLRAVLEG